MVHELTRFGRDDTAGNSVDKGDGSRGGNRQRAVAVGGCRKGQVGQREQYSSLHTTAGVQMPRFDEHPSACISVVHFHELDAALAGELIMQEESLQPFRILRIHILH